jgi:protein-S-isoprenylcysteine O-methyltransferase Ste14
MENLDENGGPDHAGVAFQPPVLLVIALALGFLLRRFVHLSFLEPKLSAVVGPGVVAASLVLFVWAVVTMVRGQASLPTSKPTDFIVHGGPYRISRNPIYLSMILLQLGVGVWANSLWFLILAVVSAVLLLRGVILREERYLERKFGDEYLSYKSRVRRWL